MSSIDKCKFCTNTENLVEFKIPRKPVVIQVVCATCQARLFSVWNKLFAKLNF